MNDENFSIEDRIKKNMGSIKRFAKMYHKPGLSMDDLIQEGIVGLLQGDRKFDPTKIKGKKEHGWRTYVLKWVFRNIKLAATGTTSIHVPPQKRALVEQFNRCQNELMANELPCGFDEVAKHMALTDKQKRDIIRTMSAMYPVSCEQREDTDGSNPFEIESPFVTGEEKSITAELLKPENIKRMFHFLSDREKLILSLYNAGNGMTQEAIGQRIGKTGARVCQYLKEIENKVREKLQMEPCLDKYKVLKF